MTHGVHRMSSSIRKCLVDIPVRMLPFLHPSECSRASQQEALGQESRAAFLECLSEKQNSVYPSASSTGLISVCKPPDVLEIKVPPEPGRYRDQLEATGAREEEAGDPHGTNAQFKSIFSGM